MKIQVTEDNGVITAEWFPLQSGMPNVGRGATVLEAVGSLVVHDRKVELMPSPLVEAALKGDR